MPKAGELEGGCPPVFAGLSGGGSVQLVSEYERKREALAPGSPALARSRLRPRDRMWLYELHPADYALLERAVAEHDVVSDDR